MFFLGFPGFKDNWQRGAQLKENIRATIVNVIPDEIHEYVKYDVFMNKIKYLCKTQKGDISLVAGQVVERKTKDNKIYTQYRVSTKHGKKDSICNNSN